MMMMTKMSSRLHSQSRSNNSYFITDDVMHLSTLLLIYSIPRLANDRAQLTVISALSSVTRVKTCFHYGCAARCERW